MHIFDTILSKKLTRKEFLIHLGLLVLAVTGISSVMQNIANSKVANPTLKPQKGFGQGPYGI